MGRGAGVFDLVPPRAPPREVPSSRSRPSSFSNSSSSSGPNISSAACGSSGTGGSSPLCSRPRKANEMGRLSTGPSPPPRVQFLWSPPRPALRASYFLFQGSRAMHFPIRFLSGECLFAIFFASSLPFFGSAETQPSLVRRWIAGVDFDFVRKNISFSIAPAAPMVIHTEPSVALVRGVDENSGADCRATRPIIGNRLASSALTCRGASWFSDSPSYELHDKRSRHRLGSPIPSRASAF